MPRADCPTTSATLLRELLSAGGRDDAWTRFLERYGTPIYVWCRRSGLSHDDAEDVRAEVLARLAVVLRAFEYDPARRFRGWLKTVVSNAVLDYWRLRGRRPGDWASGHPDVHDLLEEVEADGGLDELAGQLDDTIVHDLDRAHRVVARVRDRIEPRTWQAFWMTAIEQRPAREAADHLGLSIAAVYMARSRVSQMLRAAGAELAGS